MENATLTKQRDTIVAKYDAIRQQQEALAYDLAQAIEQAERLNKAIDASDADVRTICFVCIKCGAYANDRTPQGTCLCDDGCGAVDFEMIVL